MLGNSRGLLLTSRKSVKATEESMFIYSILQATDKILSVSAVSWKTTTKKIHLQGLIPGIVISVI